MRFLLIGLFIMMQLWASVNLQIADLEASLMENEADHKARLDLAKLYFEMGMFKEAKVNFETVLATNPPEQVKKNIEFFLARIESYERRSRMNLYAELGAGHDSNVNAHPGEAKLLDYMVNDLGYSADGLTLSDKVASAFTQESLSGRYAYDFGRRGFWGVEANAYLYNQSFDEADDFNILYKEAAVAATYRQPSWNLTLPISKGMMDYGGKAFLAIDGFAPAATVSLDPFASLAFQGVWRTKTYDDAAYSGRDSGVTGGSLFYSRIFGAVQAGLGVGFENEAAKEDKGETFVGRVQQEIRASLSTGLFGLADLGLSALYRDIGFDDVVDATTSAKRHDRFSLLSAVMRKPFASSFALSLKASYSKNDSNYKPASYEKTQYLLSLNYFYGGL